MTEQANPVTKAEETSVTAATVASGLGYPADRVESTPTPTGWLGLNVSRETSVEVKDFKNIGEE